MEFHGVDVATQFKRMRELVPESYRAFLEFDQKAFKDGALPNRTKELIALGIAQITQCPWCIQAHTKKAAQAGASDAEIAVQPVSVRISVILHNRLRFRGRSGIGTRTRPVA